MKEPKISLFESATTCNVACEEEISETKRVKAPETEPPATKPVPKPTASPTLKDDNTKLIDGGIEAQTHQVMKNLLEVLNAAGSSLEKVIFARVYLVNFGDFDRMNSVYASYFAKDKLPARTCIGVTGLAVGASVEIDFIAAC